MNTACDGESIMDVTQQLARFAADLSYERLPHEVAERAKRLILDLTGIIIRARHDAESTPSLVAAVERLGLAEGRCSVFGDVRGYAAPAAALINGTLAHSLDFDDTHAEASIHSSAPIVPAALAAAEITGASGKDVIVAVIAGYEVQIRLSLALNPSDHYDRGFHPTATCGVFGAAAAAGKLFGLDADGIRSAFGIALSQSAGSMAFLADGAWTKRSHVGQAAQNGLTCAAMAAEGFRGVERAFEGRAGFFQAYAPNADAARAIEGLGQVWETMRLAVKPYPSCRYSHAAIDGLVALMREHRFAATDVDDVEIGLPQTGWKIIGDPASAKAAPKSVVDGQFSMPFCAAVALREGGLAWDDYGRHLHDDATLALCRKVRTAVDARAQAEFPVNMSGAVHVTTRSGAFETFVTAPKGEPANFLTDDEFRAKFDGLCAPYLGADKRNRLADSLLALEQANSMQAVMALSRGHH
jgi:2-methylcitrate dehydratase PrpD